MNSNFLSKALCLVALLAATCSSNGYSMEDNRTNISNSTMNPRNQNNNSSGSRMNNISSSHTNNNEGDDTISDNEDEKYNINKQIVEEYRVPGQSELNVFKKNVEIMTDGKSECSFAKFREFVGETTKCFKEKDEENEEWTSKKYRATIDSIQKRLDDADKVFKGAKTAHKKLSKIMENNVKEIIALSSDITKFEKQINDYQNKLTTAVSKKEALENALSEYKQIKELYRSVQVEYRAERHNCGDLLKDMNEDYKRLGQDIMNDVEQINKLNSDTFDGTSLLQGRKLKNNIKNKMTKSSKSKTMKKTEYNEKKVMQIQEDPKGESLDDENNNNINNISNETEIQNLKATIEDKEDEKLEISVKQNNKLKKVRKNKKKKNNSEVEINEEAENEEIGDKEVEGEEVESKEVEGKEVEGEEIEGEEIEGGEMEEVEEVELNKVTPKGKKEKTIETVNNNNENRGFGKGEKKKRPNLDK